MTDMTAIRWPDPSFLELGSPIFPELDNDEAAVPAAPNPKFSALPSQKGIGGKRLVLGGAVCFLLGVGFWHAVGFWGFIGTAVFGTGSDGSPAAIAAEQPVQQKRPEVHACTALVLDRKRNITYSRPCEIGAAHSIRTMPLQATYRAPTDVISR